jgi:hypothetical protein
MGTCLLYLPYAWKIFEELKITMPDQTRIQVITPEYTFRATVGVSRGSLIHWTIALLRYTWYVMLEIFGEEEWRGAMRDVNRFVVDILRKIQKFKNILAA